VLESYAPKYSARLNSTFVSANAALFALNSDLKTRIRSLPWALRVKPVHLVVPEKQENQELLELRVCLACPVLLETLLT